LARSTSDFVLLPFRRQDLDQVLALEKVCFPERPYTRQEFLLLMAYAGDGFFVAEDGGHVLGYVTSIVEGGVGTILSIAVLPQFRKNGIGDALVRSALDHMAGCGRIWLLVDRKNVAAISLYHKHSFRETGRIIKGYYPNGDDAVEMLNTL
jgi:ribosomal-protein-alanine N-acetyltransferase